METEYQEYTTFTTTTKDGQEIELAVVDEFDFEEKHYIVGALIEGDVIQDEARYIYTGDLSGDELEIGKIEEEEEYFRIADAYLKMEI